ncbi:MAG: hypothetical protein B7Y36_10765 [Novosphingobium sp. 28-62-57]|uniref:hypothetical protein n=1 Tax=unclassified Novosphingobium TaxID=2644732 RepID=UPI000BD8E214|nr:MULTISPECIES: hypothetical protein [unclassified Novosphingobium]OYW48674.1 MAG: hypothetical protein B7Z34_13190 [Novosphingobium sp. 12-62-10]OYZ10226.1 MAG: hypothetical protein B7Y36_10765 [Novosphingobium sp. 28-62-57]OZA34861.1 MAG: hypothetical protein B7X92_10000 [Novosphingobium sp. 17-62-9]HQS70437.1 hypothetical protein [Novosphingobium sp.]
MKSFLRNVSPRRAAVDLWEVLGAPSEYRFVGLMMAAAVTGGIFYVMNQQGGRDLPPPPKIVYFPSFVEGRTDAQILAENREATAKARAAEAEEEASAERVRQMYRAVGNATGIDADKAYADGNAERAAIKAKIAAERKAILDRNLVKNPVFEAEQKKLQEKSETPGE